MSARDVAINIIAFYYGGGEIGSKLQPSDTADTYSKIYDTEL